MHPSHEENIRNFRRYWHEMVPHAYDDSVELMERLIDAGHDVTMLTNFAADTFVEARVTLPVPRASAWRDGFRRNPHDQAGTRHL